MSRKRMSDFRARSTSSSCSHFSNPDNKVAETKTCGDETRKLVIEAVAMSRDTARTLRWREQQFRLEAPYERRIAALLLAQNVDDKCKKMPAHIRTEFDGRIVAITKGFKQLTASRR